MTHPRLSSDHIRYCRILDAIRKVLKQPKHHHLCARASKQRNEVAAYSKLHEESSIAMTFDYLGPDCTRHIRFDWRLFNWWIYRRILKIILFDAHQLHVKSCIHTHVIDYTISWSICVKLAPRVKQTYRSVNPKLIPSQFYRLHSIRLQAKHKASSKFILSATLLHYWLLFFIS